MSARTIKVLGTKVLREGDKDGKHWTLRAVEALDHDGQPIAEQLKTFADLKPGDVQVEVERQDSEQYGTSFLLKPVKKNGGGGGGGGGVGGGDLAELRGRVERLESEVKRLSSIVDRRDFELPSEAKPFQPQPQADF